MSIVFGMLSGLINGLFGSGAGMVVLPGLVSVFKLDAKVARGTCLFILVMISCITSFFYVQNINNYTALWFVTAGGIFGGIVGANLVNIIPEFYLKLILGIIMIVSGLRMIG